MSKPPQLRRLLFAPYHLYTHRQELLALLPQLTNTGWEIDVVLPFDEPSRLDTMAAEAAQLPGRPDVFNFTVHQWASRANRSVAARVLRVLALVIYAIQTTRLLLTRHHDLLLLTTDVGGLSVRFIQMAAARRGIPVLILQTTLFLRLAERKELQMSVPSGWLRQLLTLGSLKRLFLFCGEVPGTFLPTSCVAVQNQEIRDICIEFGKAPERVAVFGSLQSHRIVAERDSRSHTVQTPLRVLFITECVEERFGFSVASRHVEAVRDMARMAGDQIALTVRFHPRESEAYRDYLCRALDGLCEIDRNPDPVASVAASDVIVGVFSMLLFDAQAAGITSVFLDAGCDPIGFYNSRRAPLVDGGGALLQAVVAARVDIPPPAATSDAMWAQDLANWIIEVARRP